MMMNNPWKDMKPSTKRRVISDTYNDFYWIVDIESKYGFYIKSKSNIKDNIEIIKLKGISILINNSNNIKELYLTLNHKEDWQLFLTLCTDLVSLSQTYDDKTLFSAVENRLKRWQLFLRKNNQIDFSLQKQMGLFSELDFLLNTLSKNIGLEKAVNYWVGPDFDKQDFLLPDKIIEIKSTKTSKNKSVTISSANQLYSEKEPIYLVVYSLTPTKDKGTSVDNTIKLINKLLQKESVKVIEEFENKIFSYGYIPDISIQKYKFIIDNISYYHVNNEFPKVTPINIKSQIIRLSYDIDLLQCETFKIDRIFFKD